MVEPDRTQKSQKGLPSISAMLLGLLLAIMVGILIYGFSSNLFISKELRMTLDELVRYERPMKNPPSDERIQFLNMSIEELTRYSDDFRSWLFMRDTRAGKLTRDALNFKETLYTIERRLRDQALAGGVTLPTSLGFEDYQSVIPKEDELDDLYYELELFESIGQAIVSKGPVSVEVFGFRVPKPVSVEGIPKHTEFVLDLTLKTSFERLGSFLNDLRRLPHLVSVSKWLVEAEEENPSSIRAVMEIRAVYL